jgi:hypothetical protein
MKTPNKKIIALAKKELKGKMLQNALYAINNAVQPTKEDMKWAKEQIKKSRPH